MNDINKVLVCVDLSEYSLQTIDFALAMANDRDTQFLLLNVINSRDVEAMESVDVYLPESMNVGEYVHQVKCTREEKMKKMVEDHFTSQITKIDFLVQVGIPYKTILNVIEKEDIGLVVLANKGRGNRIGTLHGSNGEKVFRHSPVPVLSFRNRELFANNKANRL